jgi:alkanesulfonate monooxygenase SsuD/methylene tetrahydromethanopterin reductase-like flavin-dependent oxidoreductase (luciferase family)
VIELGIFTFADIAGPVSPRERIRDIVDYGAYADEAGLDVFGVGEHHTPRFAVSSPAVVLAAVAARTSTTTLSSAVSVLSVLDPVRLHQDFAQLDLVSGGRAEITAGRSAYAEPFEIFGVPLENYDAVFDEKLDLLLKLRTGNPVTWTGNFRPPLHGATITPRTGRALPVRLGVGGTAASAARAARLGLPMTLAVLLGRPQQAKPVADRYWQTGQELGHKADELSIGVVSHFHVGTTSQTARDTFYPHYRSYVSDGRGIDITRPAFDALASPHGALMVGSPQEVIDKIMLEHELLRLDRFMGQIDLGGLRRADALRSIELFATEVAPVLRRELAHQLRPR